MKKIIIDPHNCSKEEFQELKDYLDAQSWDYKEEEVQEEPEILYVLGDGTINGVSLDEKIRDEDMHEYYITHRESFLEELMRWIGEANKDKELMKQDLEMLMGWDDEYILTSNSTNSYLGQGDSDFDTACQELLELHEGLQ